MRVASCMILLAVLCATVSGCSLFKKNTNGAGGSANSGGPAPAKFPGAPPDPLLNSGGNPPPPAPTPTSALKPTTILAGTVTDVYHRPVGNAYIRLVNLEEKEAGAPIDVVADVGGHFVIQGVKSGAAYKLIARTKLGDRMLAGTALTHAPNARLMISIREDLFNASTPPLPGSPAYQAPQNTSKNNDDNSFGGGVNKSALEPNLPATLTVPHPTNTPVGNPPGAQGGTNFVPGIADNSIERKSLPLLNIPGGPQRPAVGPQDLQREPNDTKFDTGPTLVPSCVLVGDHLENMALKDAKGQVWEYRKQGRGKLIVLDFWATYCIPCRDSVPWLNRLQTKFASRGVEVIGIALESGTDERKETAAVAKFASVNKVNYRQLLGKIGSFDAGKSFHVKAVPTLVLLDQNGNVFWTEVGKLDAAGFERIERAIQYRLDNRKS